MNTTGKVLVFLNFVGVLVFVGFMALDFQRRENYKTPLEEHQKELKVARANGAALAETSASLANQVTAAKNDLEAKKLELAIEQAKFATERADMEGKLKDAEARGQLTDINFQKILAAQERMRQEMDGLKKVIEDREDRLLKLHARYKDLQDLALTYERDLRFSQERNQILVERVLELERLLAESQTPAPKTVLPGRIFEANPPAKFVKGEVENVDGTDKQLVRISLGTDHGVNKNHTLEVYRANPPEYIGIIRIEDAYNHTSVARLIRAPGATTTAKQLRKGDIVSSSLTPR